MYCWNSRIPVGFIGDEMVPEFGGTEPRRYYNRSTREQRCQKARQQSVYMEKRHDQQSPVFKRQSVRTFDVLCIAQYHSGIMYSITHPLSL